MKESGSMINDMSGDMNYTKMATLIKVTTSTESHRDRVPTLGITEKYTRGYGRKESRVDMVFGKEYTRTVTSETGRITNHMGSECTLGWMEIGMKASGRTGCEKELELTPLETVTDTLESTSRAFQTVKASTSGAAETPT